MDTGNSHYEDTHRRMNNLAEKGLYFLGAVRVEKRLHGPSIMASGNELAFNKIKPFLEATAAKDW